MGQSVASLTVTSQNGPSCAGHTSPVGQTSLKRQRRWPYHLSPAGAVQDHPFQHAVGCPKMPISCHLFCEMGTTGTVRRPSCRLHELRLVTSLTKACPSYAPSRGAARHSSDRIFIQHH